MTYTEEVIATRITELLERQVVALERAAIAQERLTEALLREDDTDDRA